MISKKLRYCFITALAALSTAALCVAAGGCRKKPAPAEPVTALSTVVKDGKKGAEYTVEGVVYGAVSDGYFISDTTGEIFVKDSTKVAVGDKLNVKGFFTLNQNATGLENATVTKKASGQAALKPTQTTLKNVNALAAGRTQYYRYFTVGGTLTQNGGGYKLAEGADELIFDARSNTQHFGEWIGKKIDISVITCGYSTSWEAVFTGGASDIKEHPTDLDAVKADIFETVDRALAKEAYFALDLPATYALEPGVGFEWAVVEGGSAISVANNVATITEPSQTVAAKLRLTLSCGGKTASQDYTVEIKYAPEVALDKLSETEAGAVVKAQGKIIVKGYSQVQSRIGVLVTDSGGNIAAIDVPRAVFGSLKQGDTVKVAGTFTSDGVARLVASDAVILQSDPAYTVDYASLNAIELATDEDYAALAADVYGNSNKLFKITAPYLIYSGNTTYNFVRFGPNPRNAQNGWPVTSGDQTINWLYCFSRNTLDLNVAGLEQRLNIPFLSGGAKKYDAYTIYAYGMYHGDTTWQFVIPDMNAVIVDTDVIADQQIKEAFGATFVEAREAGTLTLPRSTADFEIFGWTASKEGIINCQTGEYVAVTGMETVILTAHFMVNGEEHTVNIEVTFMGTEPEYSTVSEAMEMEDGTISFLKGVVIGFGPNTGTGIPGGAQMGVYISDGRQIMYIPEGQFTRSDDTVNYDKVYTLPDGHRLAVGDELFFMSAVKAGNYLTLGARVTLNAEKVEVVWLPAEGYAQIGSFADMQTYFTNTENVGKLVKFVGTAESPLYLGGSSSTYDSLNLKFYYGDIEGGVTSNSVKIGGRTIAAKARSSEHSLGLTWWKTLNPDMPDAWARTDTAYGFTGEIYAVWSATTTSYNQLALLSGGFNLKALTDEEIARREIEALVPETVSAGEAGSISLPASTAHAADISWTSSNPEILANDGTYVAVTAETRVTLTAGYTVGGKSQKLEITITLIPATVTALTVTEAVAQGGEIAVLKDAVFTGFAPAHSGSGYPVAFYLSDGVSVVTVTAAKGQLAFTDKKAEVTLGGTALEVGHKLTLTNVMLSGNVLTCTDLTTGELAEGKVNVGGNWFNPNPETLTVIASDADLAAWMANVKKLGTTEYNGEANKYRVVKVVATQETPIYIGAAAKYFLTFYYLDSEKTGSTTLTDASYDIAEGANTGTKVPYFGTHTTALALNVGDSWVLDNTPMTALGEYAEYAYTATPGAESPAGTYAFTGEFYFIFEYAGSASYPYVYVGILGAGFNLTRVAA